MHLSPLPPHPVAKAAVRSKALVLLLLICCLLLLPLWESVIVLIPLWESVIVLCFGVRYFISILVVQYLDGEARAGCLACFVFLLSHDSCVALPCDVMGLSAVCDCGIS